MEKKASLSVKTNTINRSKNSDSITYYKSYIDMETLAIYDKFIEIGIDSLFAF